VDLRIRLANEADLPAMEAIKHDAGLAAWPHILPADVLDALPFPDRWAAAITSDDPRVGVLVAELDRRVVGFAMTRPSGDPDAEATTGELDALYVEPGLWGSGAGRALLADAADSLWEAGFATATLWTAELNHRPRRIYEAAGWRADGMDRRRELAGFAFLEVRYRIEIGPKL
jgi:GNAT superfamily N-acetyltransferase